MAAARHTDWVVLIYIVLALIGLGMHHHVVYFATKSPIEGWESSRS
jgi:hypothetical protein